jgi:mannose-6-phosphate isomerase-like protein (cupin superfamily)
VARLTLQPGCSIGLHQHLYEEEIYYVMRGTALLCESADDPGTLMQPGDATLACSGASHAISNPGSEPLEVLAVILLAPPGT